MIKFSKFIKIILSMYKFLKSISSNLSYVLSLLFFDNPNYKHECVNNFNMYVMMASLNVGSRLEKRIHIPHMQINERPLLPYSFPAGYRVTRNASQRLISGSAQETMNLPELERKGNLYSVLKSRRAIAMKRAVGAGGVPNDVKIFQNI